MVRRIFDMALQGKSTLDIAKTLNAEGIPTSNGKKWLKTTIHFVLTNEAYAGTVVWGEKAKDGAPPVRVEDAHLGIVSKQEFRRIARMMQSRAPKKVNPRRASSPYLLSGLAKCETCGKAMTAAEAKSGKYTYYICHSLLKRGRGACKTPRLNARKFEKVIVDEIRASILTESNIRDLVKLLDEEMDGVARDQRERLESIDGELEEVKKQLGRVWHFIAKSDSVDVAEASDLIVELRERKETLEVAAEEARGLLKERRQLLDSADTIATFAEEMSDFLKTSELTETRAFVHSFVKEVQVKPGRAAIIYPMPTPDDSPIGGADAAEIALNGRVMNSVLHGGPVDGRQYHLRAVAGPRVSLPKSSAWSSLWCVKPGEHKNYSGGHAPGDHLSQNPTSPRKGCPQHIPRLLPEYRSWRGWGRLARPWLQPRLSSGSSDRSHPSGKGLTSHLATLRSYQQQQGGQHQ